MSMAKYLAKLMQSKSSQNIDRLNQQMLPFDEMEAKAFDLAGLIDKPVNSLKGSVGHTLGAAGLVESVMNIEGLLNSMVVPTVGFELLGVSKPLRVSSQLNKLETRTCLKTGSGFGGCKAAILFQKD